LSEVYGIGEKKLADLGSMILEVVASRYPSPVQNAAVHRNDLPGGGPPSAQ